jgi:signal transduction histidine kinase/Tfp pilus assembly protein PilF
MGKLPPLRHLILSVISSILLINVGIAQQTPPLADSLLREIQTATEDSTKFKLFLQLSLEFGNSNPQFVIDYAIQALDIAEKIDNKEYMTRALNILGIGYKRQGNFDKTLECFTRGLEISRSGGLVDNIPQFLNNIGLVHANRGDGNEAMKFYHEALNMLDEEKDEISVSNLINNIGIIYSEQGNSEEALNYFERSLIIQREIKDSLGISIGLTNIGETLYILGNKDEALEDYEEALGISQKINDQYGVSYLLASIGEINFDQGKYEQANDNLFNALEIVDNLGDVEGETRILGLLGKTFQKRGDYNKSNEYCFEALDLAKTMGAKQYLKDLYEIIAENYKLSENFEAAYNYQVLGKSVNDSLFNEEISRQINELSVQYETKKREAEVQLLKEEQAKNEALLQRRTLIGWSTALVLLFVSFIAYSLYQNNQRKQKFNKQLRKEVEERTGELKQSNVQLEKSNKELEQFAYITSHDLKEPLRNIISFTDLIDRNLLGELDEETEDYMHTVKSNARQMHSLIEGVLEFARIENIDFHKEKVDLNTILEKIQSVLLASLQEKNVQLKIGNLQEVIGNSSQLFLVLKNLVENAMKYNNNPEPKIVVTSNVVGGFCHVSVKDNGIGIDKEYHTKIFDMFQRLHIRREYKGAGLGLSICKKIIQNLGGDIWVESELGKGSSFIFSIPHVEKG